MLQVGVARHQGVGVDLGLREHLLLQVRRLLCDIEQQVAHVEAFGGRALIVATAPGLQAAGDVVAHPLGEVVLRLHQKRAGVRADRESLRRRCRTSPADLRAGSRPERGARIPVSVSITAWARSVSRYSRNRRRRRGMLGISSHSTNTRVRGPRRASSRNASSLPLIAVPPVAVLAGPEPNRRQVICRQSACEVEIDMNGECHVGVAEDTPVSPFRHR